MPLKGVRAADLEEGEQLCERRCPRRTTPDEVAPNEILEREAIGPTGIGLKLSLGFLTSRVLAEHRLCACPEPRRDAESTFKLNGCLSGDRCLALDDLVY